MKNELVIDYVSEPSTTELAILMDGISAEAQIKKGHNPVKSYAFFIKNSEGTIKGGISGCFLYGCLVIDQLWVDQALRGKSYGTQLMKKAEELGLKHHCKFSSVNTMDWEAKDFYAKFGYRVEFKRVGYDKDSTFYFLRKELTTLNEIV